MFYFLNFDLYFKQSLEAFFKIEGILFIFSVSSVSQLGDIIVSYFKRKSKKKDTGNLIPGHGGILDRIDGMVFAFPIIYLIYFYEKGFWIW